MMIVGILLIAAAIAFGVRWWLGSRASVRTDDAYVEATMVQVAPKVPGRVHQVLANTGDRVRKGQLLAQLVTDDLEADVRRASAGASASGQAVRQAQAALDYERKQVASRNAGAEAALDASELRTKQALIAADFEQQRATNQLRQARAALAATEADLTKAESDLGRMESLFSQGAISAEQRDAASNAAADARARLDGAQAQVALAEAAWAQVEIRQRDIETSHAAAREARANLQGAQAAHLQVSLRQAQVEAARDQARAADEALHLAQIALQNARVQSPTDGVIAQKLIQPGEMVGVGQPLFTITEKAGPHSVWVVANLEETKIRRVEVGQPATFTVDAYPGLVFHGRVIEIRAGTQSQFSLIPAQQPSGGFTKVTQRIPVKLAVASDNDPRLVPGMSAAVRIDVSRPYRTKSGTAAHKTVAPPGSTDSAVQSR
jgi:multidrug resistance efflux pump